MKFPFICYSIQQSCSKTFLKYYANIFEILHIFQFYKLCKQQSFESLMQLLNVILFWEIKMLFGIPSAHIRITEMGFTFCFIVCVQIPNKTQIKLKSILSLQRLPPRCPDTSFSNVNAAHHPIPGLLNKVLNFTPFSSSFNVDILHFPLARQTCLFELCVTRRFLKF